jgi:serine/threonine protein kinase
MASEEKDPNVKTRIQENKVDPFVPRILVIGCEDIILQLLENEVGHLGYEIQTCARTENALSLFKNFYYAIIFCDYKVKGKLTALELMNLCRQHSPSTKIVVVGSERDFEADPALALAAIMEGVLDVLAKPVNLKKIKDILNKALFYNKNTLAGITLYPPAGYRVIKEIASGSICKVFLVEKGKVYYAMKVFGEKTFSIEKVKRFFREAKIISSITHPNIIKIIEYGLSEQGEIPFIIMEYLPGKTLDEYIKATHMQTGHAVSIIRKIASALQVVHSYGVLHRDIKPQNVIVTMENECKLIDFGVARVFDSELTMTNAILGSPAYMAPESFVNINKIDERADIFSLGVVSYEILTGQRPFTGIGLSGIKESIMKVRPVDPMRLNSKLPILLRDIVGKMLEKIPDNRYRNISEVLEELDKYEKTKYENNYKKSFIKEIFQKTWSRMKS